MQASNPPAILSRVAKQIFISLVLESVLGLGGLILWLYLMFKTYNGEKIVLPVVGPMAEKQAGV